MIVEPAVKLIESRMAPPQQGTPRGPVTQSTNPIYVYTKFVVASARATSAIAAAMMATSNSTGVNELKALHSSANALSSLANAAAATALGKSLTHTRV